MIQNPNRQEPCADSAAHRSPKKDRRGLWWMTWYERRAADAFYDRPPQDAEFRFWADKARGYWDHEMPWWAERMGWWKDHWNARYEGVAYQFWLYNHQT